MKKVDIITLEGKSSGTIELPFQFSEEFRPDVIKRAFYSIQNNNRQPYGTNLFAGLRTSAEFKGRRRDYGSHQNRGMHRTKRIRMRSGHLTGKARGVPGAVKGRRAHPPMADRIWAQKINDKERRLAIRSAIAATIDSGIVKKRNHQLEGRAFPIIIEDKFETLKKTKEVFDVLEKLGFTAELERTKIKKVRAGVGKTRGRRYKKKVGPLIVTAKKAAIVAAAQNIAGVTIAPVRSLNAELLAPGGEAGRLTIWTKSAIETLAKENLYK